MKDLDYLKPDFLLEETQPGEKTSLIISVLIDADALVALAKADDSNHIKAVAISRGLQRKGTLFYVSPFTVGETVTVISYKVSQQAAIKLLEKLRLIDLEVYYLPDKYHDLADRWFMKQRTKGTSFFDCYNMALLERYSHDLAGIFSFDEIYRKNGFTTFS